MKALYLSDKAIEFTGKAVSQLFGIVLLLWLTHLMLGWNFIVVISEREPDEIISTTQPEKLSTGN